MKEIRKFEKDISKIKNIAFHMISTDLKIVPSDTSKISIEVELSGFKKDVEDYEPKVKVHGDTLDVSFISNRSISISLFGATFPGVKVLRAKVGVPKLLSSTIETTSGDILVDNATLRKLKITSVSGDLRISSGEFKNVLLKSTSGDIDVLQTSSQIDDVEMQTISGDIQVKEVDFSKAYFKTVSGDVKVIHVNADMKSLEVKTISGDTEILYSSRPSIHVEFSTVSGNIQADGRKLPLKMHNGSFDIGKNPRSILKIKSVSGDSKIDFGKGEKIDFPKENPDENERIFKEILESKRATPDEVRELMITLGYSQEEVENFFEKEKKA